MLSSDLAHVSCIISFDIALYSSVFKITLYSLHYIISYLIIILTFIGILYCVISLSILFYDIIGHCNTTKDNNILQNSIIRLHKI